MKILGNICLVIGALLTLSIILIGAGLPFLAVGALLRIAAAHTERKAAATPLERPGAVRRGVSNSMFDR